MLQLRYSRKPISIHAPTRGATSAVLLLPVATSNFNPRSHEGSDLRQSASTCQKSFQSTLPRGERQAADSIQARKGIISIHAPTRGATAVENPVGIISGISIHAPTRGATDLSRNSSPITGISIHAPTWGATNVTNL